MIPTTKMSIEQQYKEEARTLKILSKLQDRLIKKMGIRVFEKAFGGYVGDIPDDTMCRQIQALFKAQRTIEGRMIK